MKPSQPGGERLLRDARALRERGDVDQLLTRFGSIDRGDDPAWSDLDLVQEVARAYSLAGNSAKVEQFFGRCAELNPRRSALYLAQIAWYFQRKKRWGRAIAWYDRALETFPTYHLGLFRKGYCLERLHRPRAAAAALEAAAASFEGASPEQKERSRGIQAQVLFHLARSLREIGDTERARAALDRCAAVDTLADVVIKPEHRLASYGATYLRDGNAEAAIDCLEQARERDARSAVIWERLGLAYALAGRTADAESALVRATELPKGAVAHISLARFYLSRDRSADAARCLAAALAQHPQGEVQIRMEIAELHRHLGRPRAALEILGRLASGRVPPQSTLAVTVERRRAELLLAHGHLEQALAHVRSALAQDSEDGDCERLRGEIETQIARGKPSPPEAIEDQPLPAEVADLLVESPAREIGTIATYFPARGFGFIAYGSREQTIFFHVSQIEPGAADELHIGTPVSFAISKSARNSKLQAEDVRLLHDGDVQADEPDDLAAPAAARPPLPQV